MAISVMRYAGLLNWVREVLEGILPQMIHVLVRARKIAKPKEAVLQKKYN